MTFREKALENLIEKEVMQLRNQLIEDISNQLDEYNKEIKRYGDYNNAYKNLADRLSILKKATVNKTMPQGIFPGTIVPYSTLSINLLELDYDEMLPGN